MFADIHPVFSEIKHADREAELLLYAHVLHLVQTRQKGQDTIWDVNLLLSVVLSFLKNMIRAQRGQGCKSE
jgi:hypothetical protein